MIKWGLRILSKTPKKANNGFNEEVLIMMPPLLYYCSL
jgi:hypothetical protein